MIRSWLERRRKERERELWERGAGWAAYIVAHGASEDIREARGHVDPPFFAGDPFDRGAQEVFRLADRAYQSRTHHG